MLFVEETSAESCALCSLYINVDQNGSVETDKMAAGVTKLMK